MNSAKSPLPTVTIGVPVFNGESFLRAALDSLLAQDYGDLAIIISDNASTDSTAQICQEYAQRDKRIRYLRNDANIGAAQNHNRVFHLATSKYFMWAAHDDLCLPTFVRRCVEALEENPSAVLCMTAIRFIDEAGSHLNPEVIGKYNGMDTRGMDLRARVDQLTKTLNWYCPHGLMRCEAMRRTSLFRSTYGGDVIFLLELLFQGETLVLEEPLFLYRFARREASKHIKDITGVESDWLRLKPYTELARNLLELIQNSDQPTEVRALLCEDLLNNVSCENRAWAKKIMKENPTNDAPYLASVQIRSLLVPVGEAQLRRLRTKAYRDFLAELPPAKRLHYRVRRFVDRHVSWRFS